MLGLKFFSFITSLCKAKLKINWHAFVLQKQLRNQSLNYHNNNNLFENYLLISSKNFTPGPFKIVRFWEKIIMIIIT